MSLPIGQNSYSRVLDIIFWISMCLIPFSTSGGTGSDSVVITFAFPFLVALSIFIVYNFITKRERNYYPSDLKFTILCAFLYMFVIFISSLINKSVPTALARSIFHVFGFIMFLYVVSSSNIKKNAIIVYGKISTMFIHSGSIMSGYFIINFLIAVQQNSLDRVLLERENGGLMSLPWGASNTIAACLMMPLFVAIERAFNIKRIKKSTSVTAITTFRNKEYIAPKKGELINLLFAILLCIIAILITQSRNVLITITIGLILIGILTKNTKSILIFFGIIAAMFFIITTIYSQDLESIFSARVGDGAQDVEGFNGRTLVWDLSKAYLSKHLLQPIGYFGMLAEVGFTGHNIFITTWIEQGIIGLGIYVLFLINNLTFCAKKMFGKYLSLETRRTMIIYLIAMLSMLIQLQFEDSNLTAQNIIYYWIFLSLMYLSSYCDADESIGLYQTQ